MSNTLIQNLSTQAITVIGAGTLGRRIAAVFLSAGFQVKLCDTQEETLQAAKKYIKETFDIFKNKVNASNREVSLSNLTLHTDLKQAIDQVALIIESIPEKIELKIDLFNTLDQLTSPDVLLATNSSSYKSSEMSQGMQHPERMFNMHFATPPYRMTVELMTNGKTHQEHLEHTRALLEEISLIAVVAKKESTGFIVNRIWAAIKREAMLVAQEGVASHEDIDKLMDVLYQLKPFEKMDQVGLDVVHDIEAHYVAERDYLPDTALNYVKQYVEQGKLGEKSGEGFYDYQANSKKQ